DAATGKEVRSLVGHKDSVRACAFSPDGRHILSGSRDTMLKVWDAATGREVRSLEGHKDSVRACAFSPNGRQILSGSDDRTLKLWEAEKGRELGSWVLGWRVHSISIHPRQRTRVVAALTNGTLALVDISNRFR